MKIINGVSVWKKVSEFWFEVFTLCTDFTQFCDNFQFKSLGIEIKMSKITIEITDDFRVSYGRVLWIERNYKKILLLIDITSDHRRPRCQRCTRLTINTVIEIFNWKL